MVRRKEDQVKQNPKDLILLEKEKVLAFADPLLTKNLEIEIFDSLPSTNDYLLNIVNEKKIILAFALLKHKPMARAVEVVSGFPLLLKISIYPFYGISKKKLANYQA